MAQAKRKSPNGGNGSKTRNTGETRRSRTAGREALSGSHIFYSRPESQAAFRKDVMSLYSVQWSRAAYCVSDRRPGGFTLTDKLGLIS